MPDWVSRNLPDLSRDQMLSRWGGRDRLHPGRDVRPWEPFGQQPLDLLRRLVRGRRQEFLCRVFGEMRRQQHRPAQMQPPLGDRIEDGWEAPGGTGHADALVRRHFGSAQVPNAVGKHGGKAGRSEELARVELGDVGEQIGRGAELLPVVCHEIAMQSLVGDRTLFQAVVQQRGPQRPTCARRHAVTGAAAKVPYGARLNRSRQFASGRRLCAAGHSGPCHCGAQHIGRVASGSLITTVVPSRACCCARIAVEAGLRSGS